MKRLFKTIKQDEAVEVYEKLQKNRKKVKRHALVMILLLFGVNAFAWFTFITEADFNFNATVVAWDVNFYNDSTEVNNIVINVGEIYPGFGDTSVDSNNLPYKKTVEISNDGDVPATFIYKVESFKIMGQNAIVGEYSDVEFISLMESMYPFTIKLTSSSNKVAPGEKLNFEFSLYWLYEDNDKYYKLNQLYEYDPSFVYYTYSDGSYVATTVDETTFPMMRDSLYLQKDDADSYFGSKCAEYEAATGNKCVSVDVKLKVAQALE